MFRVSLYAWFIVHYHSLAGHISEASWLHYCRQLELPLSSVWSFLSTSLHQIAFWSVCTLNFVLFFVAPGSFFFLYSWWVSRGGYEGNNTWSLLVDVWCRT